jgi:hypothetical protein
VITRTWQQLVTALADDGRTVRRIRVDGRYFVETQGGVWAADDNLHETVTVFDGPRVREFLGQYVLGNKATAFVDWQGYLILETTPQLTVPAYTLRVGDARARGFAIADREFGPWVGQIATGQVLGAPNPTVLLTDWMDASAFDRWVLASSSHVTAGHGSVDVLWSPDKAQVVRTDAIANPGGSNGMGGSGEVRARYCRVRHNHTSASTHAYHSTLSFFRGTS